MPPYHVSDFFHTFFIPDVEVDVLAVLRGAREVLLHLLVELGCDVLILGGEVDGRAWELLAQLPRSGVTHASACSSDQGNLVE